MADLRDPIARLKARIAKSGWGIRVDETLSFAQPELIALYALWRAKADEMGGLPPREMLDIRSLKPYLGHLSVSERVESAPGKFSYCLRLQGSYMAEMFGKVTGCCKGRGGSMHIFDKSTRFFGGNAIVAGGLPLAVGIAMADKMQNRKAVTVVFFGDGAIAEGEFHESMNLAKLWKLPVLFACENNFYAMGTALDRYESETNLTVKAASYHMKVRSVDGMDLAATTRESGCSGRPHDVRKAYRRRMKSCSSSPATIGRMLSPAW